MTVDQLNGMIKTDPSLGEQFFIGHSYFIPRKELMTQEEQKAWLNDIFEYEVLPLLEEYWFDSKSKVDEARKSMNRE